MPGLSRLLGLVWNTFGVNPALVSVDGRKLLLFEKEVRAQPFCGKLQSFPGGPELCAMCDQSRFLEARRDGQALRYRCHAGLTEFVIPVIRRGKTIALLQCGQVHDHKPTEITWAEANKTLIGAGIPSSELRALFEQNRVLPRDRQNDLLDLLDLVASRLAQADEHELRSAPGRLQVALGRAMTFIESNLTDPLTVVDIARAAAVSTRTLMRLFKQEVGTSVVNFIQQRRVVLARRLLQEPDLTCAEVAFSAGFGSVQHFNRVFRHFEGVAPMAWRKNG